ncbi:MAG TPA: cyclic pyranopterin monophosphate synthase MoaC [Fimbriimonadaceae bacterium]|nr:cyclic pyranopterin monophosphate synthase MoaC [Fimbriimonadaceae bacterium]
MSRLSHVGEDGSPRMVDVSGKAVTVRRAVAEGYVKLKPAHLDALDHLPKGDAITVAQIAGIQGGKRCADLIPLCHPIPLTHLDVRIAREGEALRIVAESRTEDRTGVEMEAYTAVVVAAITLVDMLKGVDPNLEISGVRLLEKTGGKADWKRD